MDFQHASLIYNPTSGRRRGARQQEVERARQVLAQWIPRVDLAPTAGPGDATRLAGDAVAAGADLIAACGGDGTVNETLAGMDGSATLLVLPSGTANVLAGEVGLPTTPDKAAELLPELSPFEVPLGVVRYEQPSPGVRRFLLMCGIGVDASIVYHLDESLKPYLGQGAYWLGSLEHLRRRFEPFRVRMGDKVQEGTLVVVSKSRRYGGGLVLTPRAHLLADRFEVAIFTSESPWRYVGYLAQIATGTLESSPDDVSFHFTSRLELIPSDGSSIYIETDGELAGQIPAVVELAAESVTLLLPPEYAERRPSPAKRVATLPGSSEKSAWTT